MHEGGYRIERVNDEQKRLDAQFQRQQATPQTTNEVEKVLRDSRQSFEQVRTLSPTRFRFRVVNREGEDIRDTLNEQHSENNQTNQETQGQSEVDSHSTCVERPLFDQWWEKFQDSIRTNRPGVAEKAGCYCVAKPGLAIPVVCPK